MDNTSGFNLWRILFLAIVAAVVTLIFMGNVQAEQIASRKVMTARILGMGGAFTGAADDPGAVIYNPAGLVESDFSGILVSGGPQADNLSDFRDLLDLGQEFQEADEQRLREFLEDLPTSANAAGQGAAVVSLNNSAVSADLRSSMKGEVNSGEMTAAYDYYSSTNLRLSLSSDIVRIPAEVGTAAYGINLRYNSRNTGSYEVYEDNNTVYRSQEEKSGAGLGFDGGLLLQLTPMIHMGVLVENIWAQDIDMTGEREIYEYVAKDDKWEKEEDRSDSDLSRSISPVRTGRIGIAARIPVIGTTLTADLDNAPVLSDTEADSVLFLGAENEMIFDSIRLRAGTYSYEDRVFTAGAGLNMRALTADIGAGYSPDGDFTNVVVQVELGF